MPITFVSLALCCAAACYTGPVGSAEGSTDTGGILPTTDGAEFGDSAETGDSSDSSGTETTGSTDTTDDPLPDMATGNTDPNEQIPPFDEEGCHAIYAQDLLPTFELTIHPVVWDLLEWTWDNGQMIEDMGMDPKKYHPLTEFRYGDIVIHDAEIRLRGNATHWDPIPGDKMQFQIGFHRNDPDNGHFLGIKRLCFDSHTVNRHMLRDRLSLAVMRDVGVPASCCNNARLVINGEYYGIFTNVEKVDEVFVERVFGSPIGDLWKRHGWDLKTNQETSDEERLEDFLDAHGADEVYEYYNYEQAMRVYATDAVLPNGDGKWAGGLNWYLYDNPADGKFWLLPWDMDNTFDRFSHPPDGEFPVNPDPVVWERSTSHGRPWFDAAIDDDDWFETYIDVINEVLYEHYSTEEMHGRIDEWTAQIETAVLEDENKPWTNEKYYEEVEELYQYVEQRYEFVDEWLECWKDGGKKDDDGYCEP